MAHSPEILLVPYDDRSYDRGGTEGLTAAGEQAVQDVADYLLFLNKLHFDKLFEDALILYAPKPPAEDIAHFIVNKVVAEEPDSRITMAPSYRLYEAGQNPNCVQSLDMWIEAGITESLGSPRESTLILGVVPTNIFGHMNNRPEVSLYRESSVDLSEVVTYKPGSWNPYGFNDRAEAAQAEIYSWAPLRETDSTNHLLPEHQLAHEIRQRNPVPEIQLREDVA